jgi:hypothetical protein
VKQLRRVRVALRAGLLLAGLSPGVAQADWPGLGGALTPISPPTQLSYPVIATVAGVPYVAWLEGDPGSATQIYVRHWDGSAWVQNGGSLNVNSLDDAKDPKIASVGGVPYVTWDESFQGGASQVEVKHWDGSGWVRDGGSLNVDTGASAVTPWITDVGGVPYVAFQQGVGTPSTINVERFNGTTWIQVFGALNMDTSHQALAPSIAGVGGVPYVSWEEKVFGVDELYVDRLIPARWLQVGGGTLNVDSNQNASQATVAAVGGVPYVSWQEQTNSGLGRNQVYVRHLDDSLWVRDGGSLDPDPTGGPQNPSITSIGGRPVVSFTQTADHFHTYVETWDGSVWRKVGVVGSGSQSGSGLESLTAVGAVPYSAWAQTPPPGGTTLHAGPLQPEFSSQQTIATDTGALLTARVRDDNVQLPIAFQYGPAASLSTTTATQTTDGTGSATIVEAIGGLSPTTSYSWRAIEPDGTNVIAASPTSTFTTEPSGTQSTNGAGPTGSAGPTVATGAPGPAGPPGATGPQGRAGKIELVTCKLATKKVHRVAVHFQKCTGKLVSGPVKFTVQAARTAQLLRGRRLYARVEALEGGGTLRLIVVHRVRQLTRGTYTLRIGHRRRTVELR